MGVKWQRGVGWAGLTILGPHWVPASTRPKSGRSSWAPGSTEAPLQVTSRLPRCTVESTGTACGTSALCSPPWHCSFPHRASLGRSGGRQTAWCFSTPSSPASLPSAPHLCAQGTKLPSPCWPQFPWASPAARPPPLEHQAAQNCGWGRSAHSRSHQAPRAAGTAAPAWDTRRPDSSRGLWRRASRPVGKCPAGTKGRLRCRIRGGHSRPQPGGMACPPASAT